LILLSVYSLQTIANLTSFSYQFRNSSRNLHPLLTLLWSGSLVFIYLPFLSWFGLWVGMKFRHRLRAIIVAVIGMTAWIILPVVIIITGIAILGGFDDTWLLLFSSVSTPLASIVFAAISEFPQEDMPQFIAFAIANSIFYTLCGHLFKRSCLKHADKRLGRPVPGRDHL
jgi:hypothetical protein